MTFMGQNISARLTGRGVALGLAMSLLAASCAMAAPVSNGPSSIAPTSSASSVVAVQTTKAIDADDGRIVVAQNFFQRLFGIGGNKKKKSGSSGKKKKAGAKKPRSTTPPPVKTVPKDPDAAVIAVFGDEFSQDIAFGLRDAFAKTPDVKVDIHSVRNTGLLHRGKRNPLADLAPLIESKPFTFAVVMIGLNDRGKFPAVKNEEGEVVQEEISFQQPGWESLYSKRIDAVRISLQNKEKPVYWVGLPPVKSAKLTTELNYLNDIIRSRLIERDERFIDIWDAFSNEDGDYVRRGPDLSGQDKNLRHKSGIRFTAAGRRKLAFFVEKLVIRALSQSVDEAALPDFLSSEDEAALKEGRGDRRGIFVVRQPPIDATKLLVPDDKVAVNSQDQGAINPGAGAPDLRVDDFSWPASGQ